MRRIGIADQVIVIDTDVVTFFGITEGIVHLERLHAVEVFRLWVQARVFLTRRHSGLQFIKGTTVQELLNGMVETRRGIVGKIGLARGCIRPQGLKGQAVASPLDGDSVRLVLAVILVQVALAVGKHVAALDFIVSQLFTFLEDGLHFRVIIQ